MRFGERPSCLRRWEGVNRSGAEEFPENTGNAIGACGPPTIDGPGNEASNSRLKIGSLAGGGDDASVAFSVGVSAFTFACSWALLACSNCCFRSTISFSCLVTCSIRFSKLSLCLATVVDTAVLTRVTCAFWSESCSFRSLISSVIESLTVLSPVRCLASAS